MTRLSSHPTLTPNINTTLRPNATPGPSMSLVRSLSIPSEELPSISPLNLFCIQFETTNAESRVDAMRRCFVVANAIGRDETLDNLIPYLANHVNSCDSSSVGSVPTGSEEDDEILFILAEQLGHLVCSGLVPGYRALPILSILEKLSAVEETVVRDKAVESINAIIPLLNVDTTKLANKHEEEARLQSHKTAPGLLVGMMKRLAGAEWFTAKISACGVLPVVYQYLNTLKKMPNETTTSSSSSDPDHHNGNSGGGVLGSLEETKRELRNIFKMLSEDETPMVRRGAGKHLGRFVEAVANLPYGKKSGSTGPAAAKEFVIPSGKDELMIKKTVTQELKKRVLEDIVPVYRTLASDEQDSVRLLAVQSSSSVGCALGLDPEVCDKIVLPIIKAGSSDMSWRVRHNLAKEFSIVAQSQGFHESSQLPRLTQVFESFVSLLQDFEAEVRASSVTNIARMAQLGGVELFQSHLLSILPFLADDPVMEVRSKLAQTLMDCCDPSICTALPDRVILSDFKPLLEGFLNDEYAEVQLHILSKLSRVSHLLDRMDVIVQSILAMTKAQNWRVREAVAKLLPHLAEARGVSFFEEQLLEPWMKLLLDQVAEVRMACVDGMPKLLSSTGSEWIQRIIVPNYISIYDESSSYLTRMTILQSLTSLGSAEDGMNEDLYVTITNQILRGLDDRVPNVRIVSAKGSGKMRNSSFGSSIWNAMIKPALEKRVAFDEDDDCKFFSQAALG